MSIIRAAILWIMLAVPAFAVLPDEMLSDPALEARARDISKGLRCLVCRNESIDESNSDFARDLRILVRERLTEGDTNKEAVEFIVDRYGEYVLLSPPATGSTLILWAAGPLLLGTALLVAAIYLRRRRPQGATMALTEAEKDQLDRILRE